MNIQGILKVEFYEASKVNLPFLQKNNSVDISNYTSEISQNFNFIPGTCGMKITKETNPAGSLDNINLSFIIKGNEPDIILNLDFQNRIPHIYVVTDNEGIIYILGANDRPLPNLNYTIKNDADGKGGRSISVNINLLTYLFPIYAQ